MKWRVGRTNSIPYCLFVFLQKKKIHKNKKRIPQSYHDNNAKQKNEKGIF